MSLLNKSICISIGKFRTLFFLRRENIACRAVAAYLKVVRRRKPSSAEGTRGERAREGGRGSLGGFGGPPPRKLSASMCVFNGGFLRLGPDYSRFGHKDISCRVRNRMLDKIVFRQSHVVFIFTFFLQHVALTLFHLCPRRF